MKMKKRNMLWSLALWYTCWTKSSSRSRTYVNNTVYLYSLQVTIVYIDWLCERANFQGLQNNICLKGKPPRICRCSILKCCTICNSIYLVTGVPPPQLFWFVNGKGVEGVPMNRPRSQQQQQQLHQGIPGLGSSAVDTPGVGLVSSYLDFGVLTRNVSFKL